MKPRALPLRSIAPTALCLAAALLGAPAARAQSAAVDLAFDSGSAVIRGNDGTTPASGGTTADGDGAAIQIGYHAGATVSDPFAGPWVPIAGRNTELGPTFGIGDRRGDGAADGSVAGRFGFDAVQAGLPGTGQVIAVRFYNAPQLADATAFCAVSCPAWRWAAPAFPKPAPGMAWSLDDTALVWQNGVVARTQIPIQPVQVVSSPVSQTVVPGGTVTLTVVATGTFALRYQWRKDGFAITGATQPTLVLSAVGPAQEGVYDVAISDERGSVVSQGATIGFGGGDDVPALPPWALLALAAGLFAAAARALRRPVSA